MMLRTFASMATPGVFPGLPVKEIPGSHGLPLVGSLVDRFDYFVTEGAENFFKTRIQKYKSTVLRVNMPPGPPIVSDPRVIMLLDAKTFPTLFDLTKVDKRDVLTGAYMPSTDFTGGYRTAVYQDPSEKSHGKLKAFCFEVLKMSHPRILPEFARAFEELCVEVEKEFEKEGKAAFSGQVDDLIFNFLCRALVGADPVAPAPGSLGTEGSIYVTTWLAPQVAPIASSGILPKVLDELTIHSIPLPFALVSGNYQKLYDFIDKRGSPVLDMAVKDMGIPRDEACHDLLFNLGFNAFGGMLIFFPSIVKCIAKAGGDFQREIAKEVRGAMEANGGLNMKALECMPLVRSVVYEVLRMEPPVPLQYARAKRDFMVESYEAQYEIKKGELLGAYQPLATKDPRVFANAEEFVPGRFLGEEGENLLEYVLWSNGRETEEATADNKQCAGKDIVIMVARLLVAHLFLRYDSFAVDESSSSAIFTQLTKAS
ncbi:hypothetical protein SUGI_0019870 [Cryptomeria japonica]|uniref:allene oxide synthase, chloroplastic n=1 Tax=Cryptomeria japonica TaxID=3369 RepID=UPI002408B077|nr:allene oxide synthase, chloroplastic [Cryptomeria japonica]GLJ05544.1 hypothetical protein SUGI_0019870 [Cryptomeria japonica]